MVSGGNDNGAAPRSRAGRRILTVLGAIVLTCGLVIGVAHWQVHRLQTADVAWSTPLEHGGELVVAAGRAYTYDFSHGFQVTRLSDGRKLAAGSSGADHMFVGDDGHFALAGRTRLQFFSPAGKKLWDRPLPPRAGDTAPSAIGTGTMTYRDCPTDMQEGSCTLRSVDATGTDIWTTSTGAQPSDPVRYGETQRQEDTTDGNGSMLHTIASVPVVERDGRLVEIGTDGKPLSDSISSEAATIVGDLLIETTRSGSTCRYRGVRHGKTVWTGEADCSELGESTDVIAFRERMYVGYDRASNDVMGHPLHMVGVDLTDGSTQVFDRGWSAVLEDPDKVTTVSPDVIVDQDRQALTGRSPATGQEIWRRSFDEDDLSYAADNDRRYSTLDASDGAVSVVSAKPGFWRRLALGTQSPDGLTRILDPRTGDTAATILSEHPEHVLGLGHGKGALVIAGDTLFRLQ